MLTNEGIIKTLLSYGFTFEEVDFFLRNPLELKKFWFARI